jgi:hypothetical protein
MMLSLPLSWAKGWLFGYRFNSTLPLDWTQSTTPTFRHANPSAMLDTPCASGSGRGGVGKGVIWNRTARHGTARHGTARHGTARRGTARHGTAQHSTAHSPAFSSQAGTCTNFKSALSPHCVHYSGQQHRFAQQNSRFKTYPRIAGTLQQRLPH